MNKAIREKHIKLLEDICMIETPSGNKDSINALVDMMESFSRENGYFDEKKR